ncbi:MAG: SH3 domain-containing protein [Ramlibacter sp.]|nr:SH3 domain-containing protein [Ramlibacter sp.]
MHFATLSKRILIAATLCLISLTPALARDMVSIKGSVVNMRAGPGLGKDVLWQLDKGYPLQVLKRQGSWLKVRDFENDQGWVARSQTGRTPHHIVKAPVANVRKGPGTQYKVIGQVERYELLRTRGKKAGWVHIERPSGKTGWVAKRLLWGW